MLKKIKRVGKAIRNFVWHEVCAGGICVRERMGKYEVLCIVHKNGGAMLPKGRKKLGETLAECALREFSEETGLYGAAVGGEIATFRDLMRGKKITFFSIKPGNHQTTFRDEAIIWLTVEEAYIMMKHENERDVMMKYINQIQ